MSDTFTSPLAAFDPSSMNVLSCEACEMVKTPTPVHMLVNFEVAKAEICAKLESNVIVERTQANIKEPASSRFNSHRCPEDDEESKD